MIRQLLRFIGIKSEADRAEADVRNLARECIARGILHEATWDHMARCIRREKRDSQERAVVVLAASLTIMRCINLAQRAEAECN